MRNVTKLLRDVTEVLRKRVSNSKSRNLCIPVGVLALYKMLAPFLTAYSPGESFVVLDCVRRCRAFWHVLLTKDYAVFERIR